MLNYIKFYCCLCQKFYGMAVEPPLFYFPYFCRKKHVRYHNDKKIFYGRKIICNPIRD